MPLMCYIQLIKYHWLLTQVSSKLFYFKHEMLCCMAYVRDMAVKYGIKVVYEVLQGI